MGNPFRYYKKCLQQFARILAFDDSNVKADTMLEENSEEKLESYINSRKPLMDEKRFCFLAGNAAQMVLDAAYNEGCDALNASFGGIGAFEDFIGVGEDDEED